MIIKKFQEFILKESNSGLVAAALSHAERESKNKESGSNITPDTASPAKIPVSTPVKTTNITKPTGTISAKEPIGSYGKFTPASSKSSPLVVVYGGIPVGGRESGDYMYDYFKKTGNKYNLFVAKSHKIDGPSSYASLDQKIKSGSINPSKKVLYLFSGGYRPGKDLLTKIGAESFDKIFLVDIWMGSGTVSTFYKNLVSKNPGKVEYYYTTYGGNDSSATNFIASKSSKSFKNAKNDHMSTNIDAVASLMNQF
jgi:hypothetical protein